MSNNVNNAVYGGAGNYQAPHLLVHLPESEWNRYNCIDLNEPIKKITEKKSLR